MSVNILEGELNRWVLDTNGPIARFLEKIAEDIVVSDSKEALGVPAGRGRNDTIIPRRRSGDLINSVRALPADIENGQLIVAVIADANHHGFAYWEWLRFGGQVVDGDPKLYRFLPERSYYDYNNNL